MAREVAPQTHRHCFSLLQFSPPTSRLAFLDPQVAREYGVADLDENDAWVVGDVSR